MSTIAIALAGGGPLGGIYEIGACAALSDSISGLRLDHADIYVGVSFGGRGGIGAGQRHFAG